MGDIEDAIRRRGEQAVEQKRADEQRVAEQFEAKRQKLVAEVDELAPKTLASLEAAGWPGAQLVWVKAFGLPRKPYGQRWRFWKQIAGWPAGGFPFPGKDGSSPGVTSIYLLRNGLWCMDHPTRAMSFDEVSRLWPHRTWPHGPDTPAKLPEGVLQALEQLAQMDSR